MSFINVQYIIVSAFSAFLPFKLQDEWEHSSNGSTGSRPSSGSRQGSGSRSGSRGRNNQFKAPAKVVKDVPVCFH